MRANVVIVAVGIDRVGDGEEPGQGGADDAVLYTVSVKYKRLFPMAKMFGWSSDLTVKASTVLRNQPYGEQATPNYAKCT